jgi:hypothetical protein
MSAFRENQSCGACGRTATVCVPITDYISLNTDVVSWTCPACDKANDLSRQAWDIADTCPDGSVEARVYPFPAPGAVRHAVFLLGRAITADAKKVDKIVEVRAEIREGELDEVKNWQRERGLAAAVAYYLRHFRGSVRTEYGILVQYGREWEMDAELKVDGQRHYVRSRPFGATRALVRFGLRPDVGPPCGPPATLRALVRACVTLPKTRLASAFPAWWGRRRTHSKTGWAARSSRVRIPTSPPVPPGGSGRHRGRLTPPEPPPFESPEPPARERRRQRYSAAGRNTVMRVTRDGVPGFGARSP